MTGLKISLATAVSLLLFGALVSCAPASPGALAGNSLLAPAPPPPSPKTAGLEPPPVEAHVELSSPPRFFTPGALAPQRNRAEGLIRQAESYYQSGRRHYQDGDRDAARRDFDRAVDVLLTAPEDPLVKPMLDRKLDQLVDAIHRLDLAGLGSAEVASEPVFERPPLEDLPPLTFPFDPKLRDHVVEQLRATVSQLPLEVNDEVVSYINYFSTERGHRTLLAGLKRAGRYRELIQRIFDEEGIPQELIFLAQAESGFLPRAVSRKRATGMWQFMLLRGRQYGLERTDYIDDRLDPDKATRAAARHLHDLYNRYGDWYLAMAAYNCGPGVVDRAVERTGYADFWELRRRGMLPKETSRYVPIILAMTIMVKNAKEYGLENIDADPPLEYDTVEITAPTHLQLIADLTEAPLSEISDLNPALRKNIAPPGTLLRVSRGAGEDVAAVLERIPPPERAAWRAHRVLDGETLAAIAHRYQVTARAIVAANRDTIPGISAGDLLLIPAAAPRPTPRRRATHHRSSRRHATTRLAAHRTAKH